MPAPRLLLPWAVRSVAVLLVAFGSLQLALHTAEAIFAARQGQASTEGIPAIVAWLALVGAGLVLFYVPSFGKARRP